MGTRRQLERIHAPKELCVWAQDFRENSERAWDVCPRGDWQIWLAAARHTHAQALVAAAGRCAGEAMDTTAPSVPELSESLQAALSSLEGGLSSTQCERAAEIAEFVSETSENMSILSVASAIGWTARAAESLIFATQVESSSSPIEHWDPVQDALRFAITACAQATTDAARALSLWFNSYDPIGDSHELCAKLIRNQLPPPGTTH